MAERPVLRSSEDQPPSDDFSSDLMPPDDPGRPDGQPLDHASDVIIRSKVRPPVLRESTLTRQRLIDWLNHHADDRVRVLAAEAGFGKTTLLTDWAKRTTRTVRWLKLDPVDAEWASFISYVIAAFQEGAPSFGAATLRMLGHVASLGITRDQVTGQLLAELGAVITKSTVLIIDDLQHVQGNADIQVILERLIERAPQQLTFILSGRSRPDVRLGRLTAQGSVAAIGTDELRFTIEETRDLFAKAYRMPLEGDLIDVVDARTEGWGASLQLLFSSIRGQRPAQVRDFIESLEGHRQPLYDFLAEEVLGRQPQLTQTILLHAAILERIVPSWVNAALSVLDEPPDPRTVLECLQQSDDQGLISKSAENSASRRFHPLMREFMTAHLAATVPSVTLQAMHQRVAEAAEATHWPTSAHHFIEAGLGVQAMRVVGDATITAIGSGAWGVAMKLVERVPNLEATPPIKALQARFMATSGLAEDAVALLESIDTTTVSSARDRALIRLTLANALMRTPRHTEVPSLLELVTAEQDAPAVLSELATTWIGLLTNRDNLASIRDMRRLIAVLRNEGLPLFTALAHHNLSLSLLAHGDPEKAREEVSLAIQAFKETEDDEGSVASAHVAMAHAEFELGNVREALQRARYAVTLPNAQPDVFAEAALLLVWTGAIGEAIVNLDIGLDVLRSRTLQVNVADVLTSARAATLLARGEAQRALELASQAETPYFDQNQAGAIMTVRAASAVASQPTDARIEYVQRVVDELADRRVVRWMPHARLLEAAASDHPERLQELLGGPKAPADSVLLVVADALVPALVNIDRAPVGLDHHVRRWPDRWRPVLRRAISDAGMGKGFAAAGLLSAIGDETDVALLQGWEKRQKKLVRDHRFSDGLAKRISPTLMIHDLGRAHVDLASRQVMITDVRRRAATLLLYLVSRPRHSATREQVLDALWPDQDPEAAANSLHQTLYFLRRDLVADPDHGKPLVEYVPVESDLIYLVPELVHVDSAAFARQAAELRIRDTSGPETLALLHSYVGQFAPEFEYEDWAIGWREQVHATFLDLSEQAARRRLPGQANQAAAILRHALDVDPTALELKGLLAAAMHFSGSQAAARILYEQYAIEWERDFGETPPRLQEFLASVRSGRPSSM